MIPISCLHIPQPLGHIIRRYRVLKVQQPHLFEGTWTQQSDVTMSAD